MEDFIMPWGKFRGELISAIPSNYLSWLKEGGSKDMPVSDEIAEAAEEEYQFRTKWNSHFWE